MANPACDKVGPGQIDEPTNYHNNAPTNNLTERVGLTDQQAEHPWGSTAVLLVRFASQLPASQLKTYVTNELPAAHAGPTVQRRPCGKASPCQKQAVAKHAVQEKIFT